MKTTTQFLWHDCLNMPDYPPPANAKKPAEPPAADGHCWLCGGSLGTAPWPLKQAFADTFTDFASAQRSESQHVCCACVATSKSEAYGQMAAQRGMPSHFPAKEGKGLRQLNWLYCSHVANNAGFYAQPDRPGWRELLLSPPEPPFVMAMAVNGKKHVVFRAAINHSRALFTVQADETRIVVNRAEFVELLDIVERGYDLGFSKASMLTGDYNQAACIKAGIAPWRELEAQLVPWRKLQNGLLFLVTYCCMKSD